MNNFSAYFNAVWITFALHSCIWGLDIHASFYPSLSVLTSKRYNEGFVPLNSINQSGHELRCMQIKFLFILRGKKTMAPDFYFMVEELWKTHLKKKLSYIGVLREEGRKGGQFHLTLFVAYFNVQTLLRRKHFSHEVDSAASQDAQSTFFPFSLLLFMCRQPVCLPKKVRVWPSVNSAVGKQSSRSQIKCPPVNKA